MKSIFLAIALVLGLAAPALAYPIAQPHTYVDGETLSQSVMNPNFQTIYSWANGGVDNTNIGTAGIFASQIKPGSVAQGTFGGTFGFTFLAAATNVVPLTIDGVASQTADIVDVLLTAGGTNAFKIAASGAATFGFAVTASQFNGSGAGLTSATVPNAALVTAPVTSVSASGNLASSGGTTPAITVSANPSFTSVTATTVNATNVTANTAVIANTGGIVAFQNTLVATAAASGSFSTPIPGSTTSGDGVFQRTSSTGSISMGGSTATGVMEFNPSGFSNAFVFSNYGVDFANINAKAYTNSSDRRFKKDIRPVPYGLKEILALKPSAFVWRDDGAHDLGFIAQDMKKVLPELVHTGPAPNYYLGINYAGVTPVVVRAIQEQQRQLQQQQREIEHLEALLSKRMIRRPGSAKPSH